MTHGCGAGGASRPSSRAAVDAVGRAGASPAMRSERLDSAPSRDEAPQPRGGASDTLRLRRKRLPISRSRLTAACGQPDCRGHCRRHRRLAAAVSSREHLKRLISSSWRPQAQRRYQPGVRLVRCAHPLEAPPQQARAGRAGRWPPSARRCQSCQHSTTGKASKVWCAMTVWNYFLAGASFVLKQRLLVAA